MGAFIAMLLASLAAGGGYSLLQQYLGSKTLTTQAGLAERLAKANFDRDAAANAMLSGRTAVKEKEYFARLEQMGATGHAREKELMQMAFQNQRAMGQEQNQAAMIQQLMASMQPTPSAFSGGMVDSLRSMWGAR